MTEYNKPTERVFVIEADGRPLVAFAAFSKREADGLRKEQWFREEVAALRAEGRPVWNGQSIFVVRNAEPDEIEIFRNAESAVQRDDGIVLAFLIDLDGK